jgi:methyl-accepting chemotaxis protein
MGEKSMAQMSELSNRLTNIAAQARLISLAATEIHHIGAIGDGDMQGIIDLADRIERELSELADEVHPGEPEALLG